LNPTEEARALLKVHKGHAPEAIRLVQAQLDTVYARSQSLIGLASLTITVTGFSGRLIAATNFTAQVLIIAGLVAVLLAAFWIFLRVMPVRWITSDLDAGAESALALAIHRRNLKTNATRIGSWILFVGLVLYLAAVSIMLLHPEPLSVPVR